MANRIPLIVNPAASQIQEFNESTDSLLGAIPIGGIIMWSGKIADIPPNYDLCNGSNGTPDLRNRFVIGANADDGGNATTNIETGTYSGSNIAKQTGGFKNAVLQTHDHKYAFASENSTTPDIGNNFGSSGITNVTKVQDPINELSQTGGDDGTDLAGYTADTQKVGVNQAGGDSNSQTGCDANLPPYFALAYIMRTT